MTESIEARFKMER